jgi:replication factor A2
MYVRVTGGLKSFGSKRYINALHVRPVTDAFEVFFHQLEVITVTLTIERGAVRGSPFVTRVNSDSLP